MPLYEGATAPETYQLTVTSKDVDLTTVTAATFEVRDEAGTVSTWAATLSGATATTIVVTHTFAAGELVPGMLAIYAKLAVPGGFVRSATRAQRVFPRFATT